jgi:hypothetical protein
MKCEQFLFEGSYVFESGDCERLGVDAQDHLRKCASCHAQFHQFRNGVHSLKSESLAPTRQRLHQAIGLVIAEESARFSPRSFGRVWVQMAMALLVLVGSIVSIAYQDHPSEVTPLYARR